MNILLAILMILLIIRMILNYRKTKHKAGTDSEIRTITFDPASFQIREGFEYR